jgi:hypothetical protein
MDIDVTVRRQAIHTYFLKEDYDSLEFLGLEMMGPPNKHLACDTYVIDLLMPNAPLDVKPQLIAFLKKLPEVPELTPGAVVIYHHGRAATHYGLMKGDHVLSKWGHGPVFLHRVEDVPLDYGNRVTFHLATKTLSDYLIYLEQNKFRKLT